MRRFLSYLWWPVLFAGSLGLVCLGMATGHDILAFNLTYLGLAVTVAVVERLMPHEREWLANDGQMGPDLAHTLLNKGLAQVIITVVTFMGIAD